MIDCAARRGPTRAVKDRPPSCLASPAPRSYIAPMDQHARLLHLLERAEATTRDFLVETAPMVAKYHAALIAEGMAPPDALAAAIDAQRQLLAGFMAAEWED